MREKEGLQRRYVDCARMVVVEMMLVGTFLGFVFMVVLFHCYLKRQKKTMDEVKFRLSCANDSYLGGKNRWRINTVREVELWV